MSTRYKCDIPKGKFLENSQYSGDRYGKCSRSGSNSKNTSRVEDHDLLITPYLQKKLDLLSRAQKNYIQTKERPKINPYTTGLIISMQQLYTKRILFGLRCLEKLSSPLAFTQCPRCDYVGLSLLTKSTKEQISPRFYEKVIKILPNTRIIGKSTPQSSRNQSTRPSIPDKNLRIPINPYNGNNIYNVLQEKNIDKVPKLDISNIKKVKSRVNAKKSAEIIMLMFRKRTKWAFEQLWSFESWFDYDVNCDYNRGLERKYTFGNVEHSELEQGSVIEKDDYSAFEDSLYFDYPSPSQTQKTAFKILHSRIKKVLFRRKLHIFVHMHNILM
ncbi:hypothetical protein SteCoe_23998 [Stentor coeruleus]|uniref:Uncharacterized protein n=1 Tax=Stentor coeruleus TaxID=5963 RepID=A0A1R2BIL9_9CILI|nr:hypothetical protein SteCoe_23998 [Stentor coeruleus]